MLKRIDNLPTNIVGFRAEGVLTRANYEETLIPFLKQAHKMGQRLRFLYQLGPDFSGITPGAAMEDLFVGMRYLSLFERCAVVSDINWIQDATKIFGALIPCPTRAFKNAEFPSAVEWLANSETETRSAV